MRDIILTEKKGAATKANKKVWLKALVELGGTNGEVGTMDIYASEADDAPIGVDDPRMLDKL